MNMNYITSSLFKDHYYNNFFALWNVIEITFHLKLFFFRLYANIIVVGLFFLQNLINALIKKTITVSRHENYTVS